MRHLLLSGGPAHDFSATSAALAELLEPTGVVTTVVTEPADAVALLVAARSGDVQPWSLVTVNTLRWGMDAERYAHLRDEQAVQLTDADAAVLEAHVTGGGGLLALHTAVICFDAHPTWHRLCGASWRWEGSSHPPPQPSEVHVTAAGAEHPITAGLPAFTIDDEIYGFLDEEDGLVPLLTSEHGGRDHPLVWARQVGRGRVVTDLLGHGVESLANPQHRTVLTRAAAWACEERSDGA